jgi:flagellar L-ring protein precursor FlgH
MRSRLLPLALAALLPGCGVLANLAEVGKPPPVSASTDPTLDPNWRPMTMPTPAPQPPPPVANSLWRPGSRAFFKDERASKVGDLVTIVVSMNDGATMNDNTMEMRTDNETMGLPGFFGLGAVLPSFLKSSNPANLVNMNSGTNLNTIGQIQRNEVVTVRLAAVVTQVLPNGNLVVTARQEMLVNAELRQVKVTGVIRPEDIASDNTVPHDRIAEARITYSGRGQLTEVNEPRWGQQMLDVLLPF